MNCTLPKGNHDNHDMILAAAASSEMSAFFLNCGKGFSFFFSVLRFISKPLVILWD